MSSGYGRIERAILASLLPPGRALVTRALTREVYQLPPRAPVNESQLASVRRALGALCAAGRVGRVRRDQSGQRWRRIGRLDPAEAMRHAAGKSSAEDDHVSLDDWSKLDPAARVALLAPQLTGRRPRFNKQENADIEWAQWSWNPITGCLHTCPYCYAREIATSPKMADLYPFGFAPTLHPRRLLAPRFMRVPTAAARDTRHRNVFLGSMADIFGRWVPAEWIEAVLAEVRAAPDWNFLCLTKFPKRMAEFDIPANCWMGTSVDLQARVAAAEAAFANIGAAVKWLSCEPLIEPLKFQHLDRFHWIVIGGAAPTSKTPAWHPPRDWIVDLERQARAAGVYVYEKTNLLARTTELPFDAPTGGASAKAPAVFQYLG